MKFVSGKALAITYEALLFSFVLPAAILLTINNDIGPSAQITWIATGWTLASAVLQTIAGRCSDIFGRRNFFIAGNIVALAGESMQIVFPIPTANDLQGCSVACRYVSSITPKSPRLISLFKRIESDNDHCGHCLDGMDSVVRYPFSDKAHA